MTTIGVKGAVTDRVLPMDIPSYAYHYPSLKSVKLAAVKEGIFNPCIPTFRRMDMDTNRQKLSDEHCQTSTTCAPEDFRRATTTLFSDPKTKLNAKEITETGRSLHRYYSAPDELKKTRLEWSTFLNKCPERFNIRLPELPQNKDVSFRGYAVRYLRPEITSSWRYTLRQEPSLDAYSQRPIPANVYARYRDTNPQYNRNISSEAWR